MFKRRAGGRSSHCWLRGRRRLHSGPRAFAISALWGLEESLVAINRRVITPAEFRSGIIPTNDPTLIRYLDEHPDELQALSPRQFEELVSELLRRTGYAVELGPGSKDGGVDVFAERRGEFGPELTLVQCKRYRHDRKVGEPTVKQLYADVTVRNATRGLLVTTSAFTLPALRLIEDVRYRLAGKDITKLREWLKQLNAL